MDEDGFGMISYAKLNIYGFIDQEANIVSKFHYYTDAELEVQILDKVHKDAEQKLKDIKKQIAMKKLCTLIIMVVAAYVTAFAQKQLTITCEGTGESFEVIVPDGFKIYEYNSNWLDSIPYLLEHARNKESWAYENLARCYRYGIGTEKCIVNALIYYDESNLKAGDIAEEAYSSDPTDELGFMNYLLESLDKNRLSIEDADSLIDNYPMPHPQWMVKMKTIFKNKDVEDLEGYIKSTIDWHTISGDELVVSLASLEILRPNTIPVVSRPPKAEYMEKLILVAEKLPVLYSVGGDKYWELYEDCPTDESAMRNAVELYHKAYLHGILSTRGAVEVLDYHDSNRLYDGFPFTKAEMEHLDTLYSKEYRINYKSPCVVIEEVAVDENPVELIEEAE